MKNSERYKSSIYGAIIGAAIGDAIGEKAHHVYKKCDLIDWIDNQEMLEYTDDTAMMIGLLESIIANNGRLETEHIGDRFRRNWSREPMRGYAEGPPMIFFAVDTKVAKTYKEAVKRAAVAYPDKKGSYGNGAAMRVAPIGLLYEKNIYRYAKMSSIATHIHPIGIDGAAILAKAISELFYVYNDLNYIRFCSLLEKFSKTKEMRKQINYLYEYLVSNAEPENVVTRLGNGIGAHQSVPYSLYSFISNKNSFADCLFTSCLYGYDRDTMCAMACALSGTYNGVEEIPKEWYGKIENKEYLETLSEWLWMMKIGNYEYKKTDKYIKWVKWINEDNKIKCGELLEEL